MNDFGKQFLKHFLKCINSILMILIINQAEFNHKTFLEREINKTAVNLINWHFWYVSNQTRQSFRDNIKKYCALNNTSEKCLFKLMLKPVSFLPCLTKCESLDRKKCKSTKKSCECNLICNFCKKKYWKCSDL